MMGVRPFSVAEAMGFNRQTAWWAQLTGPAMKYLIRFDTQRGALWVSAPERADWSNADFARNREKAKRFDTREAANATVGTLMVGRGGPNPYTIVHEKV